MLDPKKATVIMIEFQNNITTEGGSLHGAVKDVMDSTNLLKNAQEMVAKTREMGATIIHAPITFDEGYKDYPMFSHPVDHNEFLSYMSGEVETADASRGYSE